MEREKRFTIPNHAGTFGSLEKGAHFILLPAGDEAPLMKKTGSREAVLLYNNVPVTHFDLEFKIQKIKI